ncbi:AgrD family cyclic lactone autoinducer peptide [Faecalitalea cylindroides]|nr:cyclic lactone autoinducer peptide [Faecalitalea cylindroides]
MNKVKKSVLKIAANIVYTCAEKGVNSTCHSLFGQIKEPKSLSRLKKHN